jgi:hypothetical protein
VVPPVDPFEPPVLLAPPSFPLPVLLELPQDEVAMNKPKSQRIIPGFCQVPEFANTTTLSK